MTIIVRRLQSIVKSGSVKWPTWLPLAAVACILAAGTSFGVHDAGLFELDRNIIENASRPGDDWATLYQGGGRAMAYQHVADPVPDDIFHPRASGDVADIPSWRWTFGSVPDTDDLTNAYAAAYADDGSLYVYFGLDRYANNGDAMVGFWFLQQHVGPNSDGTWHGQHEVGDILALSHFTGGGSIEGVEVYQWVGSGGSDDALDHVYSGRDCLSGRAGDLACAEVNTYYTLVLWPYLSKSGTTGVFPSGSFYEAGMNASALVPEASCFRTFIAETRSSTSLSAQPKDFVVGNLEMRCIHGHMYEDVDGDGDLSDGVPLQGWTINLYDEGTMVGSATTDEDGRYVFRGLTSATYHLEEVCESGWGQTVPPATGGCGSGVFDGIIVDPDNCEQGPYDFGNYREGTIVIRKATDPVDGTGFTFSDDIEAPHFFSRDDGGSKTFLNLMPGAYSVVEDDRTPLWDLTALVCSDPDGGSSADPDARTAWIDLDAGETVECTFTSTQRGTVIINKLTVPEGGTGFDFAYGIEAPILFQQGDGGSRTFSFVAPGDYTVCEDESVPEWRLADLMCVDPDGGSTVDVDMRTASIDLDPGETVECTFTNRHRGTVIHLPLIVR